MVFLLVLLTIGVVISIQLLLEHAERARSTAQIRAAAEAAIPPGHLFIHDGHTWARLDTSGEAKVGIDHFLLKILGGADRVFFPAEGRAVSQGERIFSVIRGGREIRLVSPIEGVVSTLNARADLNDDSVRKNPYGEGWLFTIRPRNLTESLKNLRSIDSAAGWFDGEVKRFSSFLVAGTPRFAEVGATMQDGGQYPAGILGKMDDEQIRSFERNFLV
jgi:glycine cleavage system H lipoate-binding protein